MDSLTKVLLEDLLEVENKKVTAIYGGGFKPPTKGHFNVVEKAAEQNPEIDNIIIYVGGGERDGITQGESIQIWELYKKYLPLKTTIEPVKAPIGDILRYAKDHPDEEILWIIGARENNPEDFADIASRTRTIDKYPNLELRVIQTSGGVSGTAARKAVRDNNKEQFFHLIPDIPEKEQVWDIVSPVIKELVTDTEIICDNCGWEWEIADGGNDLYICHKCGHDNNPDLEEGTCGYDTDVKTGKKLNIPGGLEEGRPKKKDPKKGTGKKPEGSGRRLYTDEDPKDTVRIKFKTKEDIVDTLNKKQFKAKSHARQSQVINLIHQRVRAAYGKAKDPEVKARLKRALDYIESRKEASKKKTERLRKMKEASDPQAGTALPYGSGFAPLEEGRYDSIARQLAKYTINGWKDDFQSGEPTGRVEFSVGPGKDFEYEDLEFDYKGVAVFAGIQKYTHNGYAKGGIDSIVTKPAEVGATYSIPKSMLPQGWEEVYMDLTSTLRHEIEHLTQFGTNTKQGKEMAPDWEERKQIDKEGNSVKYVTLPKEVDANVQGLYLKAKKWRRPYAEVVDEYIRDFMGITNPKDVAYIKDVYNKRAKELNLPSILENDPFGINAYARELVYESFKQDWNLQDAFVSLSKFMIDNGMKIQPLPKIKVIKDDEENASNLLGKTAYYDPTGKSITLYTMNRHPKDILRSFSHEMVHHEQNLDNRLNNINTTNTNEDGDLPEIEREAYEKGNMMLRNWEDSIKNV